VSTRQKLSLIVIIDTMERIREEFPSLPDRLLGLGEMAENLCSMLDRI